MKERLLFGGVSVSCARSVRLYFSRLGLVDVDMFSPAPWPVKDLSYDSLLYQRRLSAFLWFKELPIAPRMIHSSGGVRVIWDSDLDSAVPINLRRSLPLREVLKGTLGEQDLGSVPCLRLTIGPGDRCGKSARAGISAFFAGLSNLRSLDLTAPDGVRLSNLASAIRDSAKSLALLRSLRITSDGSRHSRKPLQILLAGLTKLTSLVVSFSPTRPADQEKPKLGTWLKKSLTLSQRENLTRLEVRNAEPKELDKFCGFLSDYFINLTFLRIRLVSPTNIHRLAGLTQLESLSLDFGRVDNIVLDSLKSLPFLHSLSLSFEFAGNSLKLVCDLPLRNLSLKARNASSKNHVNLASLQHPLTETLQTLRLAAASHSNFNKIPLGFKNSAKLRSLDLLLENNWGMEYLADYLGSALPALAQLRLLLPPYNKDYGGCCNLAGALEKLERARKEATRPGIRELFIVIRGTAEVDFCRRQIKDLRAVAVRHGIKLKLELQEGR